MRASVESLEVAIDLFSDDSATLGTIALATTLGFDDVRLSRAPGGNGNRVLTVQLDSAPSGDAAPNLVAALDLVAAAMGTTAEDLLQLERCRRSTTDTHGRVEMPARERPLDRAS